MVGPFQSGFFMWGQLRSSRINCCLVKGVCSQCLSPWRQSTKRIQDHIILQSELSRLCFKFPELDRGPPATHSGKADEERNSQITAPHTSLSPDSAESKGHGEDPHHVCDGSGSSGTFHTRLEDWEEVLNESARGKLGGRKQEGKEGQSVGK